MKMIRVSHTLCACVCLGTLATAYAQVNPRKAAVLHWYNAGRSATVDTGVGPTAMAFDGESMWIANSAEGTVTRVRASHGTKLGTFPAGRSPSALAYDGAHLWAANRDANTVTKLRARDGQIVNTFPVGQSPVALAFDGTNMWVANSSDRSVTKLRAIDGAPIGTFPTGNYPTALAFDGTNIWVAGGSLTQFRAKDGARLAIFPFATSTGAVMFDGTNLWVSDQLYGSMHKLRPTDGARLASYPVGQDYSPNPTAISPYAVSLAFDGTHIWAVVRPPAGTSNQGFVKKLSVADARVQQTFQVADEPAAVAFDGLNVWVTDAANDVMKKL